MRSPLRFANVHRPCVTSMVVVAAACSLGCGSAHRPSVGGTAVSGIVTLDDKPACGAQLRFVPIGDTGGFGASATADENGRFVATSPDGETAVPPGSYKVIVQTFLLPEDPELAASAPRPSKEPTEIPLVYGDVSTTPLTVAVTNTTGAVDLQLRSRN